MSKSENGSLAHTARLCHVIKQDDFDGYGFNLHAEKGKPGQYIGKVDDASPAEVAGLKQGDRIIEVNGINIGSETHKQVVQRIKAIASEVQLTVVDPSVPVSKDNRVVEQKINGSVTKEAESDQTDNTLSSSPLPSHATTTSPDVLEQAKSIPASPSKDNVSLRSSNSASVHSADHDAKSITPTSQRKEELNNKSSSPSPIPQPAVVSAAVSTTPVTVTSTQTNNHFGNVKTEVLNLNMTAAELRAKLAAKKKFDPKNDSVDLRQKFEIVQKL